MKIDFQAIRQAARAERGRTARQLAEIITVPAFSGTEAERVRLLERLCRDAGLTDIHIDGLGSLLARLDAKKEVGAPKLVFDAHIDTVGVGDPTVWTKPPFSGGIDDVLVYGRGSADQLGGAAAMLGAARLLRELEFNGDVDVWFAFTTMEEDCDGLCWKYLIEEESFRPDYFVSTEPTSCRLYRGHRGRMEIAVDIRGVSCHGSAPERGVNAAYAASRAALALERLNSELKPDDDGFLGKGTIVVSQIDVHGPSQCAVPDQARLYCDRRLTWGETDALAIAQVEEALRAAGVADFSVQMPVYEKPAYTGKVYPQELYFPTWKLSENHPLVAAGAAAYAGLHGRPPVIDKWTFSTNCVAVAGRHGIPCIGFGPGDEKAAHAPNETNRIDDLELCDAFYAALAFQLGG